MKWLGIENEIERKARDKGINIYINGLLKHGVKEDDIISDISEAYDISREEAEKKVRECCMQPQ